MRYKKIAEQRLRDYPNYEREIATHRMSWLWRDADCNAWIKGKWTNSKAVENELLKVESSQYIQNRLFWKKCIEEMLEELDEKQRLFVSEYYFEKVYDYRSLAKKHLTNKNVIMRACDRACKLLLEKLGENVD